MKIGGMSDVRPTEVGICVSGGGIRAAAFGLGALQALQSERKLLRGESAADYLSAVSGGSYIAGAYTLASCSDRIRPTGGARDDRGATPEDPDPFAPGSPEAEHLRRHCRYMIEDGGAKTSLRLAGLAFINFIAVILLPIWFGVMIAGLGAVGRWGAREVSWDPNDGPWWLLTIAAVTALVTLGAARWLNRKYSAGDTGFIKKFAFPMTSALLLAAGLLVLMPIVLERVLEVAPLHDRDWVVDHIAVAALVVAAVIGSTVLSTFLSRVLPRGAVAFERLGRFGVSLLTRRLVQVIGLLMLIWITAWIYHGLQDFLSPNFRLVTGVLLAVIIVYPLMEFFVDRVSPHHPYRDMLVQCFSVIRTSAGSCARPHDPRRVKLSKLKPRPGETKFPQLLICAAANVSDVGATPAGSNVLSLVLSPSEIEVPAVAGATVDIGKLEALKRPIAIRKEWGPAITLASAVAMTGAAVSPAMGKMTRNDLRALFAALNLRLGVWLPNVLNPVFSRRRDPDFEWTPPKRTFLTWLFAEQLKDPWPKDEVKIGLYEHVSELFGKHSATSNHLYVSDGGHYDNLGLVELLRRECRTIWCVDASGDKPGRATALAEAILTAGGELGVRVDIDLGRFRLMKNSEYDGRVLANTHAIGTVIYPSGVEGTLVVIKIGLSDRSPDEVAEYRRRDGAFPHHSTLRQVYRAERFDAYRSLGWSSASEALRDERAPAPQQCPTDPPLQETASAALEEASGSEASPAGISSATRTTGVPTARGTP
jgi:hypothetical protein